MSLKVCDWFDPFGPKKHTFIVYCLQIFVAGSFKRIYFWIHVRHKNSKLIFFLAYFLCIMKVDRWVKFCLQRVKLWKLFNNHEKVAKKRKELLQHYFRLYSTWEIFFLKYHTKNNMWWRNRTPDPLLKNQNWVYLWINSLKCYSSFLLYVQVKGYQIYWNRAADCLLFPHIKLFQKNRKRPGSSLHASISEWFLKKKVSHVTSYSLTKFNCLITFTSGDTRQYVCCNYLFPILWRHKFWNQS